MREKGNEGGERKRHRKRERGREEERKRGREEERKRGREEERNMERGRKREEQRERIIERKGRVPYNLVFVKRNCVCIDYYQGLKSRNVTALVLLMLIRKQEKATINSDE